LPTQVLRVEAAEHAFADGVLDLVRGHPAVERVRHGELDVLDALPGRELDHLLEHQLADVGAPHRRKRDRDVVDRDREPHAGLEELFEGF
jgi:hypothetical protein